LLANRCCYRRFKALKSEALGVDGCRIVVELDGFVTARQIADPEKTVNRRQE